MTGPNHKYEAGSSWGDLGDFIAFMAEGGTNEDKKVEMNEFYSVGA